jgi:non-ribosomal peptide synthetase component F
MPTEHQEVPFEKVVELAVKERDMGRSPLFQVMFALQNTPEIEALHLGDLQLSRMVGTAGHHSSRFELSFILTETADGLNLTMEYCTDLFSETTILGMAAHFRNLLQSILRSPHQIIGALPMMDELEINHLLVEMNDTKKQFDTSKTVVDIFSEQVKKNSHAIALVEGGQQLTYGQLNEASNKLAHYLFSKGLTSESIVPICLPRTSIMVISMLGVLKAGATYAPIDPGYPADRILYMLEDTGASILLTTHNIKSILPALANVIMVDPESDDVLLNKERVHDPQINISPRVSLLM